MKQDSIQQESKEINRRIRIRGKINKMADISSNILIITLKYVNILNILLRTECSCSPRMKPYP